MTTHTEPLALVRPEAGTVLADRYRLIEPAGRGGSAVVWRAEDVELRREVAVKVFFDPADTEDTSARRQSELDLVAGLDHPNLVRVLDAGYEGGLLTFLVMEYVGGTTLRGRLRHGPLTSAEAAQVGAGLAAALAYVHERGIVHRDIKPANVLLPDPDDAQLRVKLTDFGVARLLDSTRLTAHGLTVGTANYLSPEQVTGQPVTGASDVYSLGLLLLECLTGELVFAGHGVAAAVARLHRAPSAPAWLDARWRSLLEAMTAQDPHERPGLPEISARLRAILAGPAPELPAPFVLRPRTADAAEPAMAPPARSRGLRSWLPLAGLAAAAATVLFVLAGQDSPTGPQAVATTPSSSAPPASATHAPATRSAVGRPTMTAEPTANLAAAIPTPHRVTTHRPPHHHKHGHGKHDG